MANYWLDPRTWTRAWAPPPWYWWIRPSGGDSRTSWGNALVDFILESPTGSHTLGSAIAWGIGFAAVTTLPPVWAAFVFAAMWALVGQGQKADALLPLQRYSGREIVWRVLLGTIPLAAILYAFR